MKFKAVIFDMDGVIFDSERATYAEWLALADKYGMKDIEKVYPRIIGSNEREGRRTILSVYGEDFPYDQFTKERSQAYHRKYDGGRVPKKPGIRELLQYLQEEGCYMAVASSSNSAVVRAQIRDAGFESFFTKIIGGDMVGASKPQPDIFLEALKGSGIDPQEAAVIEDSHNGIRAAYAGGMFPVMVPDMMPVTEEMKEKAGIILPSLVEVKVWLQSTEE